MKEIYLDYAAGSYLDFKVLKKMMPFMLGEFGNPSSSHNKGLRAKKAVQGAKKTISNIIGGSPRELIFTSSGTESVNLAIFGVTEHYRKYGKHIIVSKIEHKAVLEAVANLRHKGFEITYLDVDSSGHVDLEQLKKSIREDTILISIIYANNEIGTVQNLNKISKIIKTYKNYNNLPIFHTDACQAPGLLNINVGALGVDLMTLNSAKIYGPKGAGLLYKNKKIIISPMIFGGGQEYGLRSGTENVPAIIGFAEALKMADSNKSKEVRRLKQLKTFILGNLFKKYKNITINGDINNGLANIINVSLADKTGERRVLELSKRGIYVSTGSACISQGAGEPSHVLKALGLNNKIALGSIRISLGKKTTKEDLLCLLKEL
jgi:cysteine desulfurase